MYLDASCLELLQFISPQTNGADAGAHLPGAAALPARWIVNFRPTDILPLCPRIPSTRMCM